MIGQPPLAFETVLIHRVSIERDHATTDDLGGRHARDWQPLATVPCFLWWGTGALVARIGGPQVRPEQTVELNIGGMVLPQDTDITARDRISEVLDAHGNQIAGRLEVLAVAKFEGLIELSFRRVS